MTRFFNVLATSVVVAQGSQSPITKVLNLLGKMETEIQANMKEDAQISKKLQCWAETTRREKTNAIETAEASIQETTAKIEKLTGLTDQLKVTVEKIDKDIADNENDLKKLEDERANAAEEFRKYETETTTNVQQLNGAIQILKKHQGGKAALTQLRKALAKASLAFPQLAAIEESRSAVALLEYSPHASASGEIFGVLSQMLETMDADLASRQKQEADAIETFNQMRTAKKDELAQLRTQRRSKKDELAEKLEDLARAKKSVRQTTDILAVDRKILAEVNAKGSEDKEELSQRVAAQNEELAAIRETVKILTSDESRQHFEKTKPSFFLQLAKRSKRSSALNADKKARVVAALRRVNSPELSLLATNVQLAAFEEVKKMISNLIKDLKAKKEAEQKKRDFCVKGFDTNKVQSDETSNLLEDLISHQEGLEAKSKELAGQIEATKKSTEELLHNVAQGTELRTASSFEYQQKFQDYLTTKNILSQAIVRLQQFYNDKQNFLQQKIAPVGLKKGGYQKKNGGGVVSMIRMIIADAEKSAMEEQSDEKKSQLEYETGMNDSIAEQKALASQLASLEEAKADTDQESQQTGQDKSSAIKNLDNLQTEAKALHTECDFLIANFDNRQAGFAQEAEALQSAVEILSGAQV